jgi:hypothetical protein
MQEAQYSQSLSALTEADLRVTRVPVLFPQKARDTLGFRMRSDTLAAIRRAIIGSSI